jgi:hypothetical protein
MWWYISHIINYVSIGKDYLSRLLRWIKSTLLFIFYTSLVLFSKYGLVIIILIVAILVVMIAVVYIKYPFWARQPVLHTYDFARRFLCSSPFIVLKERPMKTKYYDANNMTRTVAYNDMSDRDKEAVVALLQGHYVESDGIFVDITQEYLDSEMSSVSSPKFITMYYGNMFIVDTTPIVGCISSKAVELFFPGTYTNEVISTPAYLLDNICIHSDNKKSNPDIGKIMLQTHEFRQFMLNDNNIKISLFKKEINLCNGVIPLVTYNTFTFHIPYSQKVLRMESSSFRLPKKAVVVRTLTDNKDVVMELVEAVTSLKNGLVFSASMDMGNLLSLIVSKNIFVFALKKKGKILGVYCFRDMHMQYEDFGGSSISLVASFCNTESGEVFFSGFIHALKELLTFNRKYKVVSIDSIGSNCVILSYWTRFRNYIFSTPAAYYLYNFIYPNSPVDNKKCFFLL